MWVYTPPTEYTTGGCGTYAIVYEMQHGNPDHQVQCAVLYDTRLMLQMGSAGRCLVSGAAIDRTATEHTFPDELRDLITPCERWHIREDFLVLVVVVLPRMPRVVIHIALLEGNPRYTWYTYVRLETCHLTEQTYVLSHCRTQRVCH